MARSTRATSANTPAPRYLTPEELAAWFNIKMRTVRRWRADDYGPKAIKLGHLLRYPVAEVKAFEADPEGYQHKRDMEIDLS